MSEGEWYVALTALFGAGFWIVKLLLERIIVSRVDLASQKQLETIRSELAADADARRHEHQLLQTRTTLFFDHQRRAFESLIATLATVRDDFRGTISHEYEVRSVTPQVYDRLKQTYDSSLLFLDDELDLSILYCIDAVQQTFPFRDPETDKLHYNAFRVEQAGEQFEFLFDAATQLFRAKLGLTRASKPFYRVALLVGTLIINRYHFNEIGFPHAGDLNRNNFRSIEGLVAAAEQDQVLLLFELTKLRDYLMAEKFRFWGDLIVQVELVINGIASA